MATPEPPLDIESSTVASSVVVFIGLLTLAGFLYEFWFRSTRYAKLGNQIPGPLALPIIGHAYMAIGKRPTDIFNIVVKNVKELKSDVIKAWLGPKLYVALANPEDIELILGSQVHLEKSMEYGLFEPWLGDGLLISKGERWRSHRKMIAPTFHSSILKTFMPVFNRNAQNLINLLDKEVGKTFDVHDYMSGATVDTLLETAMGVKKTNEDNTGFEYAMAVMDMCKILHLRHLKAWLRPNFLFQFSSMAKVQGSLLNTIHTLTRQVIKRKKTDYFARQALGEQSLYPKVSKEKYNVDSGLIEESGSVMSNYVRDDLDDNDEDVGEKKRLAFLDFLVEASQTKEVLTDEDIREEVNTIMFEGHDTTAAASSFFFCMLGIYKDIQEKVVEELREIFQDDFNRPITFTDTLQMKYLERVLMETVRLYPPVPIIARKINEEVKLASGDYTLPTGSTVIISQYFVHRNPKYWDNPEKFDPDRFLPENCQNRHYYAFIPFSAGPRSCVGRKYAMLKLKVLLADVLRKFKFHSTLPEKDFRLQADIILKREEGFTVQIERRK